MEKTSSDDLSSFIIIDHGETEIRVGFANEDKPKHIFPSITGKKRSTIGGNMMMGGLKKPNENDNQKLIFSNEAIGQSNLLRIENTIEKRKNLVLSARQLYKYAFQLLNVIDGDSTTIKGDYKIIYLASFEINEIFKDEIKNIFTNFFNFKSYYIIPSSLAANYLFEISNNTLLIDIGTSITSLCYLENGQINLSKSKEFESGGVNATNFLKECYDDNEYFKYGSLAIINSFKEQNIIIALDLQEEIKNYSNKKIPLVIEESSYDFGVELVKAGEIIINRLLEEIKENADVVYMYGGCSKIKNFSERLEKELKNKFNNGKVISNEYEKTLIPWMGAQKMVMKNFEFELVSLK